MVRILSWVFAGTCLASLSGCAQWFIDDADGEVYALIKQGQSAALGTNRSAHVGEEAAEAGWRARSAHGGDPYAYVPQPLEDEVPEPFRRPPRPPAEEGDGESGSGAIDQARPQPFTLADALAYAMAHSREFQTAKEDLYLAALALSLERHLWTPQFTGGLSFEFADFGQVRDFDRAMTAVAEVAVSQRLPLGGTVTARLIDTWMRDLEVHTTSAETGQVILSADIPLLRGAGWVASESRFQAERDMIYAVRDFERFRREFVVSIASDFFNLLSSQAQIDNAYKTLQGFAANYRRAESLRDAGRSDIFDSARAQSSWRSSEAQWERAKEAYGTALDGFKIRLGMSVDTPIDVIEQEVDLYAPPVTEGEALETALRFRLDLLTERDLVDDARRRVVVAKNNLLPDFNVSGSVTLDSDPVRKNVTRFNTERATWRGLAELELPLDRKRERNDYRSALIVLRRAERAASEAADRVRLEVRRAMRRLELQRSTMEIQEENVRENEIRLEAAELSFQLSRSTNQDVVDAQNELLRARNDLDDARSGYRRAILEFLRDTGTLRVGDDGRWMVPEAAPPPSDTDAL